MEANRTHGAFSWNELATPDPEVAGAFYAKLFGWKIERWSGPSEYWLMTEGDEGHPGITGGIAGRLEPKGVVRAGMNGHVNGAVPRGKQKASARRGASCPSTSRSVSNESTSRP